jgi:hypothetical protein
VTVESAIMNGVTWSRRLVATISTSVSTSSGR